MKLQTYKYTPYWDCSGCRVSEESLVDFNLEFIAALSTGTFTNTIYKEVPTNKEWWEFWKEETFTAFVKEEEVFLTEITLSCGKVYHVKEHLWFDAEGNVNIEK